MLGGRGLLDLAGVVQFIVLDERLADRVATRLEERVGHRAADDQRIDAADHVLDHVDLVRHLRAAEDDDEGTVRLLERVAEIFQFALHQQTGRRTLHEVRDALDRCVRAMRGTERVVHVAVGERGERLSELRIVFFFFGVKAQVLEEHDFRSARLVRVGDRALCFAADAIGREQHGLADKLRQPIRDRPQAHLGIWLAFRPAQMAREHDRAPVIERVLNRRQRLADPRVVADATRFEGHVEIDADEDALALEVEIPDRELHDARLKPSRSRRHSLRATGRA